MLVVLHPHSHGHSHSREHSHSNKINRETSLHDLSKERDNKIDDESRKSWHRGRLKWRPLKKHGHLDNINVQAAFIHVIGDLIQSIGVVIAGYIIWFKVRLIT